jgi:hypothetical protein
VIKISGQLCYLDYLNDALDYSLQCKTETNAAILRDLVFLYIFLNFMLIKLK